ncbi:MAG: iron-sulfur cluster assembly scaffold protein [bacterium]|nr:iron-sulfur cluster assembly scaffold protein [bacterium]
MMYNKVVTDCFFHPKHVGLLDLSNPLVVHFRAKQYKNGTLIDLYMQGNTNNAIEKICYKTNGNPYIIAALEWLCREVEGKRFDQLPLINYQILINVLDISINQLPAAVHIEQIYQYVLSLMKKKFEE